jgi:hypothetical protein
MKDEASVEIAHLRWGYEALVGDRDAVERAIEVRGPIIEEVMKFRKSRRVIVILPDERLDQFREIGKPVKDLGGCQAVTLELLREVAFSSHRQNPPIDSSAERPPVKRGI